MNSFKVYYSVCKQNFYYSWNEINQLKFKLLWHLIWFIVEIIKLC